MTITGNESPIRVDSVESISPDLFDDVRWGFLKKI
jgi:hypothetical protein